MHCANKRTKFTINNKKGNYMKISCCLITTNIESRLHLLNQLIDSIDKCNNSSDIFNEKIISVDMFNNGINNSYFEKFNKKNWIVYYKNVDARRSMILNQKKIIEKAKNDIIFYTEDDIIINKMPTFKTINLLFNTKAINNKKVGFICYNTHVFIEYQKYEDQKVVEYINDLNNYVIFNDDVFLIKSEVIKDRYYLNFPVAITTKQIFLKIQKNAFNKFTGSGVESAMTYSWFDMKYNELYNVLIYVKRNILEKVRRNEKITIHDFINGANMNFWNNDKNLKHKSINGRKNTIF